MALDLARGAQVDQLAHVLDRAHRREDDGGILHEQLERVELEVAVGIHALQYRAVQLDHAVSVRAVTAQGGDEYDQKSGQDESLHCFLFSASSDIDITFFPDSCLLA